MMKTRISFLMIALAVTVVETAHAEWAVDFSRRRQQVTRDEDLTSAARPDRAPASVQRADLGGGGAVVAKDVVAYEKTEETAAEKKGFFDAVFGSNAEPVQEIVILNTEKGFVPATVHVRKNGRYKISIVNVNEKEKNVSFILDGFSEHHATYYGKVKTFMLEPKKDGVFSFQSPETAAEGKLVVFNPQVSLRNPASESDK